MFNVCLPNLVVYLLSFYVLIDMENHRFRCVIFIHAYLSQTPRSRPCLVFAAILVPHSVTGVLSPSPDR